MKTITIHDDIANENYTLAYSKGSIRKMEQQGFNINDFEKKPLSSMIDLFAGAFIQNHPSTPRKVIEELFDRLDHKDKLIEALTKLYAEPFEGLMKDNPQGKATWKING